MWKAPSPAGGGNCWGVERIGPNDDFFSLGGHSLVGVRLFAKIKKAYGVDLELAVLFELATVRQLADAIRKSLETKHRSEDSGHRWFPFSPRVREFHCFAFMPSEETSSSMSN